MLRKHLYGGIPPTDPRILAMTDELIELEMAHLELDRALRDGEKEVYHDPTFEEYDKETEEEDNLLSYEYDVPLVAGDTASEEPGDNGNEEDWEDV